MGAALLVERQLLQSCVACQLSTAPQVSGKHRNYTRGPFGMIVVVI